MLRIFSPRIFALVLGIMAFSTLLFWGFVVGSGNVLLSALVALFAGCNLALMAVLTRVWLVEQFPAVKTFLEKIPFVAFSVPVPTHLRSDLKTTQHQSPPVEQNSLSIQTRDTISADSEEPSREPFTLASMAFEPPEPIQSQDSKDAVVKPAQVPLLKRVVQEPKTPSVENAFHKSQQQPAKNIRESQLNRFYDVCRLLKQANVEISVWTEGELATLANTMLGPNSDDKDMIALLMPQHIVKIKVARTFEYGFHARVLTDIVLATGNQVSLSQVNSSKDGLTGLCEVSFNCLGKSVCWNFPEPANRLSENYVKNALRWVSKRANGTFHLLNKDDYQVSFVFIPQSIDQLLQSAVAVA